MSRETIEVYIDIVENDELSFFERTQHRIIYPFFYISVMRLKKRIDMTDIETEEEIWEILYNNIKLLKWHIDTVVKSHK